MLFNSLIFLTIFLPIALAGFAVCSRFAPNKGAGIIWMLAVSLFFYAWWDWHFLALLLGSIVFNFLVAQRLEQRRGIGLLTMAVVANLGVLVWFKYANFVADNLAGLFGLHVVLPEIVLPLAISFFTFHQIAYLVDVYRGDHAEPSFFNYALFVSFFPHLIAGPIIRHWELLPQFRQPAFRVDGEGVAVGVALVTMGLIKKMYFAPPCQTYADQVFLVASYGDPVTLIPAWTGALAFTFQIYFDFSGYSDMAIGLARMFGTRLPLNFASPYKATSIVEFWHRWHVTLSRFLRDYLYVPLGGNRKGRSRRYLNLMVVMLIGGLWHGASWTFAVWGGVHGLALAINHLWHGYRGPRPSTWWTRGWGWVLTMMVVVVAWVLFRASNWTAAQIILAGMVGMNGVFLPESYGLRLGELAQLLSDAGLNFAASPDTLIYPTRTFLLTMAVYGVWVLLLPNSQEVMAAYHPVFEPVRPASGLGKWLVWRPTIVTAMVVAALFSTALFLILQKPENVFIYFQF